jgi:hypothetical protein
MTWRFLTAIGGIGFIKKWRAETLKPGLEFDNFKPRCKTRILKLISWLIIFFFLRWLSGFYERASQDLSYMAPMSPLNSPSYFFCFHIRSLRMWLDETLLVSSSLTSITRRDVYLARLIKKIRFRSDHQNSKIKKQIRSG